MELNKYIEKIKPDVEGLIYEKDNHFYIKDDLSSRDIELSNLTGLPGDFNFRSLKNKKVGAFGIFALGKFHIRAFFVKS